MDRPTADLTAALTAHLRLTTTPVAVKLARPGETPPAKAKRPREQLGNRLAVCQGMTIARTFGWTLVFHNQDHACPLPRIFLGQLTPERFLAGAVTEFYQDDRACGRAMEASYPRWPLGSFEAVWLAPVDTCAFVPDLVVVYGSPAQILTLIQGANFRHGPGLQSRSSGRYGCATWLAGVMQSGACTYMVPGPGERIFAGTQDHEMSFAAPHAHFPRLVEGLAYVRRRGAFRFPVPNMGVLAEPRLPAKYHGLDPQTDPE